MIDLVKLLEVYDLQEVLDALGLEPIEVLTILEEQGYFNDFVLPEPL